MGLKDNIPPFWSKYTDIKPHAPRNRQLLPAKDEPVKSCLLFLRNHILNYDKNITEAWKYKMPFFCYKGKMLCYLWVHKKNGMPYLGIVKGKQIDHPELIIEDRAKMKIMLFDPEEDIPVETIDYILKVAISLY